jgi:hypothetical protein
VQRGSELEELLQLRLVFCLRGLQVELLQGVDGEDPDAVTLGQLRGLCGRHSVYHRSPREVVANLHLRKVEISREPEEILQTQ